MLADKKSHVLPRKYFITLVIIAVATFLQWLLWPIINPAPFLLYYPAIILASIYGEILSAIWISALVIQFFFSSQEFTPAFDWPADGVRQGVFILSAYMMRWALVRSARRLRILAAVAETSNDFVGISDPQMRPIFINRAGLSMVGLGSLDEAFRLRVLDFFWEEDRFLIENVAIPELKEKGRWIGEVRLKNFKTGKPIDIRWNASVIYDEKGNSIAWAIVSPDLTGLKQALRESSDLTLELQRALHAKDEFISVASHELKTPITSLKLQIQIRQRLIQRRIESAFSFEKMQKMLDADARQVDRLVRLIDDMLDMSKISSGRFLIFFERFEFCGLLKDVLERMTPQLNAAGSSVILENCDSTWGVWDRNRIEQVITNLLSNAIKYGAGLPIRVSVTRLPNSMEFKVQDQGRGIAKEDQERVFHRFERAVPASAISGLGLGLYIVRQITEIHGGQVRVESELGKGATFIVTLPLAAHQMRAKAG